MKETHGTIVKQFILRLQLQIFKHSKQEKAIKPWKNEICSCSVICQAHNNYCINVNVAKKRRTYYSDYKSSYCDRTKEKNQINALTTAALSESAHKQYSVLSFMAMY